MNNIEVYSPQPENFREITKELTTQYCQLRHKHEKDLKAYKDSFKKEIADYIQNIIESGISKRNIEYHRSAFEKLVNICDYSSPTQKVKTPEDIAEYIFSMLIQTISENKSNTMFAYKEQYMEAYDSIISYYKKYFEIKFAINEFKKMEYLCLL